MDKPQPPADPPVGAPDWPQVEDGFWRSLQSTYESEDKILADEYRRSKASIQVTLSELYHERTSVAERLRRIDALCSAEEARMETLQSQYEDNRRVRFAVRDGTVAKMKQWFSSNNRGMASAVPSVSVPPPTPGLAVKPMPSAMNMGAPIMSARTVPLPSVITNEPTGVEICDPNGNVLGPLNKIRTRNPVIDAIRDRPVIKRRVRIRPNRKYTAMNLPLLYEPTDTKGGKWIACMIQATGDVQPGRCSICEKGQGPFEECVMLDREGFSKCGNCEWSRQGCHGSSRDPSAPPPTERDREAAAARQFAPRSPGAVPGTSLAGTHQHYHPHSFPVARPVSPTAASGAAPIHAPVKKTPNPNKHTLDGNHLGDLSYRPAISAEGDDASHQAGQEPGGMVMITPRNLALKHDGVIYSEPECMRGVPVAKIDPSHPYWDPSWEDIEGIVRPQYQKWLAKQDHVLKTGGVAQHAKFQIGRQVNRGARVLDFLKNGPISPYQLLAKQYMVVGKGGIVSYDTLFRLANTLEELNQFRLAVDPLDWLRHRMHEIVTAEGDKFNLARTMHDFYHDPKLTELRRMSGFSQIGRPSGARVAGSNGPAPKRRKGNETPRSTPPTTPALWRSSFAPANRPYPGQQSPALGSRTEDNGEDIDLPDAEDDADADADGNVTDTDSHCGEAIEPTDFRVYQVKHRNLSSNPAMTQYWHWLDDEDERSLQHQVLKDVNPTQWGMYREPLNFSVNFQEILEVLWAPSSRRVIVIMDTTAREGDGKPRGDVLVHFKRGRTLRRFCRHLASKGIRVSRIPGAEIEDHWDRMRCEMLPSHDDDDNIEV